MILSLTFINALLSQPYYPFQLSLVNNPISMLARNNNIVNENPYLFNHEITYRVPITDQKSSGRCWLFASLNVVRLVTLQNWNQTDLMNDFELSQNYLYFWDKFERYHHNLIVYSKINKMENKSNYLSHFLKDPMGDGGQWDMAKELINKYGIVPKSVMPDTYHSKSSSGMNKILTEQLKNDFITIKNLGMSSLVIENMMTKIFNFLVGFLGKPPVKFDYIFKSNNTIHNWKSMTPMQFLEKTNFNADDWVTIMHDPRKQYPYYKMYEVEFLGNVKDQHVGWLNLPMKRLKELTKISIDSNLPVWFGCDVGNEYDKNSGIHAPNIINKEMFLNTNLHLSKEERLNMYLSLPTHAMVILGYHEEEIRVGEFQIKRWKIENSWGKDSGSDGFLLMTDDWFSEYVFEIIIHKSKLSIFEKKILSSEPIVVPIYDPLNNLMIT
jgi:bleomycin hydrolase